jgi:short-subunit dehydrogenase involved in D-alanine esterification of teichoic acids
MRTRDNTVLITGGSAGIGLAIAKAFAGAGNTVIVCGRDQARLEKAREAVPGIHTIQCDVASDDELDNLLSRVRNDFPQLNVLVNNAAMMCIYDFVESPGVPEKIKDEVSTNLMAPMKLSSLFLPLLQQQATAAIVIVSSGLAYVPVADLAVYCATTAALHSFSHSLRYRLSKTAIKVFELLPPLVDTELARSLHMPKIRPEQVAGALLKSLARERYEVRVGQVNPLHILNQLAPSLAERLLNQAFSSAETRNLLGKGGPGASPLTGLRIPL